ncbi:MAG: hypothetical protein ABJO86_06125 [Lentilitoribacter sp.]
MDIYNFHTQTGEYMGASRADANPLEAGEFLIPACATTLKPLQAGEGEKAVFDGNEWRIQKDNRGVDYWLDDGSHHTITELNQSIPDQALSEPPDLKNLSMRVGEFRDFMKFFSTDEQLAIVSATLSNPNLKLWYDKAMGGKYFSLDHPETTIGLKALVSAGLLTKSRMETILNGDFNQIA